MINDREVVRPSSFEPWLGSLKEDGSTVLVTGEVREGASRQITRKLLGATDVPRTRILALTDRDPANAATLLPGDVAADDEGVHIADFGCGTRAVDAASSSGGPRAEWGGRDVDDFRTAICDAITTAKEAEDGFDPAQLRVSVFTLSYLLSQHDLRTVERFVSAVGDHVRGVSGMAHYHLPMPDDSETVRRLAPLFDVRIELREKRALPEQRWHFPERDVSTTWVGLKLR